MNTATMMNSDSPPPVPRAHGAARVSPERRRWQLAVANVTALLPSQGQTKPPVDLRRLGKALGVTRLSFGPIAADALLQAERDGLRAVLKDGAPRTRSRFSWAHEIAHLLLDRPRDGAAVFRSTSQEEIESLCNSLAADILMPREMFWTALAPLGYGLAAVPTLAQTFQTSITATAIRMVKTRPVESMLCTWKTRGSRNPRLQREWSLRGGSRRQTRSVQFPWDGRGPVVPDGVTEAFRRRGIIRTKEAALVETASSEGVLRAVELPAESWGYGTGENRTVLNLVYLSPQ